MTNVLLANARLCSIVSAGLIAVIIFDCHDDYIGFANKLG